MLSYHCILTAFVLALTLSLSPVNGHPGELEPILTARQLERRQVATNKRHAAARNCDSAIVAFEAQRRAKRSLLKRNASVKMAATSTLLSASGTVSANVPTYTALQNSTCVLTPESEEGPYYIHEELLRTNITDEMEGIPLLLDIGVMDVTTCTPMEAALVDVWHCNATGIYSGFIASESTTNSGNSTDASSMSSPPSISSGSAMPSGTISMSMGGNGTGGVPGGGGSIATDQETFGRGAYPTNSDGLVEFSTVFPGFYAGRTIHIHTVVLTNYTTNDNGTIGQEAGHIQHIGQIFFEESWSQLVVATSPYNQETIERTTNDIDRVYAQENSGGYNATAQLSMLGENLSDGLLGYVTLGIDPSASYNLSSTSYYTGDDSI